MSIQVLAVRSIALLAGVACAGCASATQSGSAAASPTPTSVASPAVRVSPTALPPLVGDSTVAACRLVPQASIAAAVKESLSDGTELSGTCTLVSDDGSGGITRFTVANWQAVQNAAQAAGGQPLTGVGDEAFFARESQGLYARQGTRGLFVHFSSSVDDPAQTEAKAVAVAKLILPTLKP